MIRWLAWLYVGVAVCQSQFLAHSAAGMPFAALQVPSPPTRISLLSSSSPMFPPLLQSNILPNLCSGGENLKWSHRIRGSVHSLFNCLVLVDVVVAAERSAIRWVVKMWAEEKNPRDRWAFPAIGQPGCPPGGGVRVQSNCKLTGPAFARTISGTTILFTIVFLMDNRVHQSQSRTSLSIPNI